MITFYMINDMFPIVQHIKLTMHNMYSNVTKAKRLFDTIFLFTISYARLFETKHLINKHDI